jgi:hypothetical protein
VTFKPTNDPTVQEAANRVIALRKLTVQTGVKTYRSQSAILEGLDPQTLAAVAMLLTETESKGNVNDQPNSRTK